MSMQASYNWINELISTGLSVEETERRLTMAGLEIEGLAASGGDHILEVNVTPNRPDCLSMIGLARELSAITGKPVKMPDYKIKTETQTDFKIEIKDSGLCRRYAGRVIRGVKIAGSPDWMKARLESCGIRSINNIVDITNYVLLELGHPLHAFDLNTLKGGVIRIGVAGKGGSIKTLDGMSRSLPEDALLIWDAERPVAIAGVMGGADTEVADRTTDIFLESAWFKPESIRRTSKALGLKTEASYRFERGTDIIMLEHALNRATSLMAELSGGRIEKIVDQYPVKFSPLSIKVRYGRANKLLGTRMDKSEMLNCISNLGLGIKDEGETFSVTTAAHRQDLASEVDVIEEIARLYGYGNIPTVLPMAAISGDGGNGDALKSRAIIAVIKESLRKDGFHDAINYSFMDASHLDMLGISGGDIRRGHIGVLNPLRPEDSRMRTTLLPAMITNLKHNISQGVREIRLFEIARVFIDAGAELPNEPRRMAAIMHSEKAPALYPEAAEGFYIIKGAVQSVFSRLKITDCSFAPCLEPFMHPGKSADVIIQGARAGHVGCVSPQALERFDIKSKADVMVFELDLDAILKAAPKTATYKPIPRYPAVERDIALLIDEALTAETALGHIKAFGSDMIESASVFDSYKGKNIPQGKRSLGLSVVYRSRERTLTDAEVDEIHGRLVKHLIDKTGGAPRA